MKWYNILSAPLALLYGSAVLIRNGLFRAKLLHATQVSIPTICVGNLAVGGTGKTPFIEYLIRLLQKDYQVAVLSRGYKRTTRGYVLAGSDATADTIGDEPMQIHTNFPDVPVAVCKDRICGIKKLREQFPKLQVILLDDAYQYRRLKCGFYILLTEYNNLYIDDYFLPLGHLRDARLESLRASAVVVTKCPDTMLPIDQRIVDTKLHLPSFQQLSFSRIIYPELPRQKKVLLVTGISHPEYLFQKVKAMNPQTELMAFPDHYRYRNRDIQRITEKAQQVDVVLTTEKDMARLRVVQMSDELRSKLNVLPIQIQLVESDNLERKIRQYINENLHSDK